MNGGDGLDQSDQELVRAVQRAGEGDLRAFETLVRRHRGKVLANCRYMTRAPHDAEDLAQEVFVRAYFGLSRFRGDASFGTWVQRIKVNHCLNYLKKRARGPERVDVDAPGLQGHEALKREAKASRAVEALTERERIGVVLDRMTETLRVPLLLRDLDDLSYQEVAEHLGIGLSAVKMRIKRGREEFRRLYEELEGDGGDGSTADPDPETTEGEGG